MTRSANFRLNPNDDIIAATNTQLAYFTGNANAPATPNIGAVAYTVNLATDATTLVGATDNGTAARNLAVAGAMSVVTATRNQTDLAAGFSLCPNPVTSSIRFAFTLASTGQIKLFVFNTFQEIPFELRNYRPWNDFITILIRSKITISPFFVEIFSH